MNMDFRTVVELPAGMPSISHADRIAMWGSCFAENMGALLEEGKFQVDVNPYGILYNPFSIAKALHEVMEGKIYHAEDLIYHQERWHSLMHHSAFSADTVEKTLERINVRVSKAHAEMEHCDWLMLTFGTAYVYEWKATGEVVSNCHKLPETRFERRRLSVEEIVETYVPLIQKLKERNPRLKCLLTVSPVRHIRHALHANQLSKAVLLLAIERLQQHFPDSLFYFPSYEIVMDELRDYRFYADDMSHPSSLAVSYLWKRFGETFFTESTTRLLVEIEDVRRDLAHKPFHPESETYKKFLGKIVLKMERLKDKCPYLDFQNEMELCHTRLKK